MQKIKAVGKSTLKHWREITFVYFIQFLIGLIVGLSFCGVMCSSLDQSMVLDQLANGFDRTVIMDVINSNHGVLDGVRTMAISLLGIYLLMSVFLQAGWLTNIKHKTYSIKSLFANGLKYFLPFLGVALLSILLILVFAGGVGFGFTKVVGDPLVTFSSEKPYVIWIVILICFFVLWSIMVWSWSVSSRLQYIDKKNFFTSLKLGFNTVRRKWMKFLGIGLLIVGIHVLLMILYYCIMGDRGAPSWIVVLGGILVQQVFSFVRIFLRGFGYGLVEDLQS